MYIVYVYPTSAHFPSVFKYCCVIHTYSRRQKNRSVSVPVPFRFTGNERAEKMACRFARFARSVPPVLPSNPSACARSNESCLSGDPAYRRVCTRGRQYPPSLAPSLARPELNGRKRTERNGTAKKRGKREEKTERNGTGWNGQ